MDWGPDLEVKIGAMGGREFGKMIVKVPVHV
jgi:hypothetical protein